MSLSFIWLKVTFSVSRRKVWWLTAITSVDRDGQTPLHYVAANDALNNSDLLREMMCAGRGTFHDRHSHHDAFVKKREKQTVSDLLYRPSMWFKPDTLYSTLTGHEIACSSSATNPHTSFSSVNSRAEPKSCSKDLKTTIDENRSVLGSLSIPNEESMNFEIIVPWLLRNMNKRASDLDSKEAQPHKVLRAMAESICKDESLVLIAPQFREFLAKLGIRVTKDVIREVCRMYSADHQAVHRKWADALEQAERKKVEDRERAKKELSSMADAKNSYDETDKYKTVTEKYEKSSSSFEAKRQREESVLTGDEEDLGVDMNKYGFWKMHSHVSIIN